MIDKVLVFGYYDKLEGHHWNIGLFITICVKYFSLLCLVSLYQ